MKQKPLFNVNMLNNKQSTVYIILPDISKIDFQLINISLSFLNHYKQINLLSSDYELSFYKFLVEKSKSFSDFKNRITVDESTPALLKEIQLKDCIIIYLHHNHFTIEPSKRAILCMPNEEADVVFDKTDYKDTFLELNYLKKLATFLTINEDTSRKNFEVSTNDIVMASRITCNFVNKKFNVIFVNDMFASNKVLNTLKKNKLKKHLILISKSPMGITDPKLLIIYEYKLLDLLAFMVQADCMASSKNSINKSIISNLKLNILVSAVFKEYQVVLEETLSN